MLPHLFAALTLVRRACGPLSYAWAALLIAQGTLPVALVYLTRTLVDRVVGSLASGGGGQPLRAALVAGLAYVGVLLLWEVLAAATRWTRTAQGERIRDHVTDLIHERSISVDFAFYDSPQFYDQLHRAREESSQRSIALLEGIGVLTQNGLTLLAMVAVLVSFGWGIALALVASTLPVVAVVVTHALREYRWRVAHTADERWVRYHEWLLTSAASAAELRLFELAPHFRAAWRRVRNHLREGRVALERDRAIAEVRAVVAALVLGGVAALWMIRRALEGVYTPGDLALAYQAFQQGQGLTRGMLGNVGQIYVNALFLGSLFDFVALRSRIVDPDEPRAVPVPLREGIRFESVTFRYLASDRPVLLDFDLVVPAGRIVAVVGGNGAGKSTLVKLLCRFYDPEGGRITLDGIDLRSVALQNLRRAISVMFQEPVRYSATIAENIAAGDVAHASDVERIRSAAASAGAEDFLRHLSAGYGTLLGGYFSGGHPLSVGEWQRIGLARALFRDAPILLLDEPTSALDSWAEAEWLARLRTVTAGRTTLIITHRFTTAMRADVIHVMEEGRIVESGSHRELVVRGGRYARSWNAQAHP